MRKFSSLAWDRPRGKVFTANASGAHFGERAIFTKFHNGGSSSPHMFEDSMLRLRPMAQPYRSH
jgi:hypothetical protein